MAKDDDLLADAKEAFRIVSDWENENRNEAMDDLRFARLADQWPPEVRKQREDEGRPVLTINRLPTFIRQVTNDARQNKPAITIHPNDSAADPVTAEIMSALIRNIEYQSNADVAYDTALASAVTGGFGYFRINTRYAKDDSWDQDIVIDEVPNPFAVYGDPNSTRCDSEDWNSAFVVDLMDKALFAKRFKGADESDWDQVDGYSTLRAPWVEENQIRVAEWWVRDEIKREITMLTSGDVVGLEDYLRDKPMWDAFGVSIVGQTRAVSSYKVTQRLMSGAEILHTTDWAGTYIPIVPVYGDEVNVGGVRHWRSMVRDMKDPQRMFNYWRTMATELVALAPKAPYIGPKGAFDSDLAKWETANSEAHAWIEYDGSVPPQRQPFAGVPVGAVHEAMSAADDLKAISGIYDASLGARGNETSGLAINARKVEGDTATFHYIDNLARGIRCAGRIILDLIPKVYSAPRVLRIMGPDKSQIAVPVNQKLQVQQPAGAPIEHIFDLTAGKYDLTVVSGPSFTTRRAEAANQMLELIRAYPNAAPVLGDLLAENLDWPGADKVAHRLKMLLPQALQTDSDDAQGEPGQPPIPPQVAAAMKQMQSQGQALQQQVQALTQQNQQLTLTNQQLQQQYELKSEANDISRFKANTERLKAAHEITAPTPPAKAS